MNISELVRYLNGPFEYWRHAKQDGPLKLCMAMQIKDEADIIELNIRYHASQGCEKFFIVDNGSVDGTREIVESLKQTFDIAVFEDERPGHYQAENMTMLTHLARSEGYDWVIENDADEFWYPKRGDLKFGLDRRQTVLRVERYNVIPHADPEIGWLKSPWHTWNTLNFLEKNKVDNNWLFAPVLHKVMVNPFGLARVNGGNHGARHALDKLKGRKYGGWNKNIKIFHYALRSYEHFEKKAINVCRSLAYMKKRGKRHNFGPQAVSWCESYRKGNLRSIYESMLIDNNNMDCYKRFGLAVHDDSLFRTMQTLKLVS